MAYPDVLDMDPRSPTFLQIHPSWRDHLESKKVDEKQTKQEETTMLRTEQQDKLDGKVEEAAQLKQEFDDRADDLKKEIDEIDGPELDFDSDIKELAKRVEELKASTTRPSYEIDRIFERLGYLEKRNREREKTEMERQSSFTYYGPIPNYSSERPIPDTHGGVIFWLLALTAVVVFAIFT